MTRTLVIAAGAIGVIIVDQVAGSYEARIFAIGALVGTLLMCLAIVLDELERR